MELSYISRSNFPTAFLLLFYLELRFCERAFFTFRRFLPYTPSHICQSTASTTDLRERFLF